nr:AT4g39730/T19P19_120 [Arabidopsis thaliana]
MARRDVLLPFLLLLATVSAVAFAEDDPDCVYTFYLRTGSIWKAGTDSIISARIYDKDGDYIGIKNLQAWAGLMGPDYNYFERGNLDIFSGRAPCLPSPICALNLTSDGSGDHHGWYVNYVEITTAGFTHSARRRILRLSNGSLLILLLMSSPPYGTIVRSSLGIVLVGSGLRFGKSFLGSFK